ncbi:MAG: phenylalanine--tRNA ligase subunit beta [archaeon]
MPTITLNKDAFEKLVGKKLPLEELKDRISMLGTDLEKIEGNDIVVEVFPNRPDMLSEPGFARALSSFIGVKTGLREYKTKKGGADYRIIIDASVKEVRPFTACAIVKNLKFDDEKIREVIQLQEKLHVTFGRNRKKLAIGIYPLEKIKLPIAYTAKKPDEIKFRPLESERMMTGSEILEKHPTGKEYAHLLKGKKLYPIFIDANDDILSMPPIINSHLTGRITEKTKDIFIECSGFDMRVLKQCLNIIVTSLADIGGEVFEMTLEYGKQKIITPDLASLEMPLDLKYINKIIGMEFKEADIKNLLGRMGFGYKNKKVLIPPYRTDILHQIDIAEDIAIAYGYENFEPEIPNVSTVGEESAFEVFKGRIANILVGLGMVETISYHLSSKETNNAKMLHDEPVVELDNSLTAERNILRSRILPGVMQVLSENTNKEYPQNLFELGNVFRPDKACETGVKENVMLGMVLCGADVDYTRAKQAADVIMGALELKFDCSPTKHGSFIRGRAAKIMIDKQEIGLIGEMHPEVLDNFGLQMPVSAIEIDMGALFNIILKKK